MKMAKRKRKAKRAQPSELVKRNQGKQKFLFWDDFLKHTGAKIHISSKNSHGQKITYFKKFTVSKSHYQQNSHFQNRIFLKNLIFKIAIFTKITFLKSHFSQKSHFRSQFSTKTAFSKSYFSQKSHYLNHQNQVNLCTKNVILPQCALFKRVFVSFVALFSHCVFVPFLWSQESSA